jgi:hypothetical protein
MPSLQGRNRWFSRAEAGFVLFCRFVILLFAKRSHRHLKLHEARKLRVTEDTTVFWEPHDVAVPLRR